MVNIKMKVFCLLALLGCAFVQATDYFEERFGEGWEDRWVQSEHKSDLGKFVLSAGKFYGDAELDKGPDICGPGTKKVHVIFNYKGENKLIKKDIRCKDDVFTHLYTLIVKSDNTYEVKIDNAKVESGSLEEDWDLLKPKKIKDPEAKKPEDWDDNEKIDDPEDTKPEDWEKPEHIPDPDAKKPDDWDDEMDGEWEPPMIDNPEYKGEWKAKQIDNPAYKGKWIHPEIDNPEYEADDSLYKYSDFGAIGFDLWQVKSGTIFDNVLITDDIAKAEQVGKDVWGATKDAEKKMKDQQDEEERKQREAEEAKRKEEEGDKADEEEEGDDEDEGEEEEEDDHDHDEFFISFDGKELVFPFSGTIHVAKRSIMGET
ncbi:CALR-like protein [Mya arenaria]|uniref:Calreticulin n=1 Tax=Mya arenaria TaxID=6604 RepID=A0ABY7FTW8_MYAAR|nr:CALR-like protein [Mya arenaria]